MLDRDVDSQEIAFPGLDRATRGAQLGKRNGRSATGQ